MNNRLLGLLGVIGGVGLTAVEVRHLILGTILNGASVDPIDEILFAIWGLGCMLAFWGIYKLGVTGSKKWMRWVPLVAVIGFAAMAIGSIVDVIGLANSRNNPIFFVAWPLLLIGTLLTAILALVSRKWASWRKFAPLLVVLALPLGLLLSSLTSEASSVLFGLAWIILGFAVLTSEVPLPFQVTQA